jgi:hypothetical protein
MNNDIKNEDQNEEIEVEDLTEGEFEVDLHDLGITAEDIQVMKRIDARLTERLRHAQQAQAGTSNAPMTTRLKGKDRELTTQELEEQLNKLRKELRCKAMRQAIRDRLAMMNSPRQALKPVPQVPQPQRLCQQPILIEEELYSDEEEGEYEMPHQHRPQQGLATPLSAEFEQILWPPRFNPTILPQYDGDSDPKYFLLNTNTPTSQVATSTPGTSSEESSLLLSERRSLNKSTHVTSTT